VHQKIFNIKIPKKENQCLAPETIFKNAYNFFLVFTFNERLFLLQELKALILQQFLLALETLANLSLSGLFIL
jgi:hypothetical protein